MDGKPFGLRTSSVTLEFENGVPPREGVFVVAAGDAKRCGGRDRGLRCGLPW
jgi:hypothetical protein